MKFSTKNSLKIMYAEAGLTTMVFAMPILNIFFAKEIGMSLTQVGIAQAVFTASLLLLNIPTGWLADRFSLKWTNVIGNTITALGFLFYANSQSFNEVIIGEIIVGIGMSLSVGADAGLLKAYAKKLTSTYEKVYANISILRPISEIFAVSIGGLVGAFNPRLAISLSCVSFGLAAILCVFIENSGERRLSEHHPLKDMGIIAKYALHGHKKLKWSIFAYALSREITHPAVWIFTPLMLLAGVPASVLGIGWSLNLIMTIIGATLARKFSLSMPDWKKFALPMAFVITGSLILGLDINSLTIFMYLLLGLSRGWVSATMLPIVQKHTPNDMQATVVSVAGSTAQLMYIPLIIGTGYLANISLNLALLSAGLFIIPTYIVTRKLAGKT